MPHWKQLTKARLVRAKQRRARRRRTGWRIALGVAVTGLLALAAVVLRLATDRGTLVLELDHPDAAVTIDGRQVSMQIQGESLQIALPSGKHEMLVVKDGFKAYTDRFTMERGERVVLKVHLEPPRPEPVAGSQTPQRPVASPLKASITPLASSEAMLDWVRSNTKPATMPLVIRDLSPPVQQQLQADCGCSFNIGRGLTKSGSMAILAAHNGHYFVCQFSPTASYPEMTAAYFAGAENVKRSANDAKLSELKIENADDLDPDQDVRGSVTLEALCDKKANYGVRLTCRSLVLTQRIGWTPASSHGAERIEFRQFPLTAINVHGPVLVFVELCLFPDRDDQPPVIVSDPLPALVNVR